MLPKYSSFFRICLLFLSFDIVVCQVLINKGFDQELQKLVFDSGQNWRHLSSINSLGDPLMDSFHSDLLYFKKGIGYFKDEKFQSFYLTGRFIFKKYLFAFYDANFSNAKKNHFFDDEISMSGVGFKNDWVCIFLSWLEFVNI